MLKGKYLKVKDLFPVYEGVNVTVDADEKLVKQHGPTMARPATLPCRTYQVLDVEEYTKAIQDEVFEAIRKVRCGIDYPTQKLYFKGLKANALINECEGSDFMAMYEKYQEGTRKEREEALQKKIKEAKKLLEENGYVVGMQME